MLGTISPLTYTAEKLVDGKSIKKITIQLNHVVSVIDIVGFKVNPEEHSEGIWATKEDVEGLAMTDEMRGVVMDAFDWMESESAREQ